MKYFLYISGIDCSGGAIQRSADDSRHYIPFGLRVHGGQRGHLRHLPAAAVHREAVLRQPQPAYLTSKLLDFLDLHLCY